MMDQNDKTKALDRLKRLKDEIDSPYLAEGSPSFTKWERSVRKTIEIINDKDSDDVSGFTRLFRGLHVRELHDVFREPLYDQFTFADALEHAKALLESMIEDNEDTLTDDDDDRVLPSSPVQDPKKVFLVHGHDSGVKNAVARFLQNNGLTVVILDEIAGQGRTIIEKVEDHSSVGYAVVLMTPDDIATGPDGGEPDYRARQNVIFELGFFVGKLQRGRVCVISKEGIELPSNYWGVEYIPWDAGEGWKFKLQRELRAANLDVQEA